MTKTELKKFVEEKRREQLRLLSEAAEKEKELVKDKIVSDKEVIGLMAAITEHMLPAESLVADLLERLKVLGVEFSEYYGIPQGFKNAFRYIGEDSALFPNRLKEEFNTERTTGLSAVHGKSKQMTKDINKNFDNVIANMTALPSARKCIEYLTELGFKVPADGEPVTLPAVQVDTKYLFMGKAVVK
ncbi:MAG: hypothetical protein ACK5MN_03270 [Lachnospiraceae bacterium]